MDRMKVLEKIEFPNLFSGGIEINRVAVSIFGIDIYWYGILIAAGVILGFLYAMKRAEKVGLIADTVFDTAFIAAVFAFICARAYYCVFYNLNPENTNKYTFVTAITGIRDGGLAVYGGIIGGVLTGVIVCRIKKVPIAPILDLTGPGFFIGQAIGRWGNFVNQEAFGAPTAGNLPWGMTGTVIAASPEVIAAQEQTTDMVLVHPCFLYESLWCLAGFLIIHFIINRLRKFDGEAFLFYVVWYGTGRGWIEGLRTDSLYIGSIRVSQLVAVSSAIIGLILIVYFRINARKNNYVLYVETEKSREIINAYKKRQILEKEFAAGKKAMKRTELYENTPKIIDDRKSGDSDRDKEE